MCFPHAIISPEIATSPRLSLKHSGVRTRLLAMTIMRESGFLVRAVAQSVPTICFNSKPNNCHNRVLEQSGTSKRSGAGRTVGEGAKKGRIRMMGTADHQ